MMMTFFRRAFLASAIASICVVAACSESTDGITDAGPSSSTTSDSGGAGADAGSNPGTDSGPGDKDPFDATTSSASAVLINEVSGGDEWIEIVNSGATPTDIGGWKVADREKQSGGPKLDEAVTIPSGTTLAANAYGMIRGGGLDAGKDCPKGGQAFCLHAEFGISKKNGETLFLLGSDGGIAGTVVFPATDASTTAASWCRIPNAAPSGTFENCPETPGAANKGQ